MAKVDTSKLTPMNLARVTTQLDKLYRFSDGVRSLRDQLATLQGVKKQWDGACDYNRRHFNSLDAKAQRAYEARLAAKRYYTIDGMTVPKIVYDVVEGVEAAPQMTMTA